MLTGMSYLGLSSNDEQSDGDPIPAVQTVLAEWTSEKQRMLIGKDNLKEDRISIT